jgi:PKD repeat protein
LQNYNDDKYEILAGASDFSETLPNLAVKYGTLSVKGLPSGLKYDRYTGCITGTARKAGVYTATLTVANGKQKSISTITIDVKPLPSWAVGTFEIFQHVYGKDGSTGDNCWDSVSGGCLTISSSGVISGRLTELGKTAKNLNWKNLKIVGLNDNGFVVLRNSTSISSKEIWNLEFEIFPREVNGVTVGTIIGESFGRDEDADAYSGDFYGLQNVWKLPERGYSPSFADGTQITIDMEDLMDRYRNFEEGEFPYIYGGYLTLNFKQKGVVLAEYSDSMGGRVLAKHSTVLALDADGENGELEAIVAISIKPVAGREGFDLLLILSLDESNGIVGEDDIQVIGYDFNFDWN